MTKQFLRRIVAAVLVLGLAVSVGAWMGDPQAKGRYKKQGDKCVWDPNDSGPNQCTPPAPAKGRFKKSGNSCVWDANDTGADQCRPAKGRFKREGSSCVWSSTDSGPDQCDPRK